MTQYCEYKYNLVFLTPLLKAGLLFAWFRPLSVWLSDS